MHSVLVRSYRYKYSREGIIPGTWYLEFLLDPCSISLGYFAMDPSVMKVNAVVTGLQDQDGKAVDDNWVSRRKKETNLIVITRHSTLVIDGTEYNNQYVQDHLTDLRILLDRIRTDTLLEEITGDD